MLINEASFQVHEGKALHKATIDYAQSIDEETGCVHQIQNSILSSPAKSLLCAAPHTLCYFQTSLLLAALPL